MTDQRGQRQQHLRQLRIANLAERFKVTWIIYLHSKSVQQIYGFFLFDFFVQMLFVGDFSRGGPFGPK